MLYHNYLFQQEVSWHRTENMLFLTSLELIFCDKICWCAKYNTLKSKGAHSHISKILQAKVNPANNFWLV